MMAYVVSEGRLFAFFRLGGGARRHDVVRSRYAAFLISGWVCEANFGARVSITFGGYATN